MLKIQEKKFKNFKEARQNRQKCRKTGEKPSKISKNWKNVLNPPKMSLNLVKPVKNIKISSKMSKNQEKNF